MYNYVRVELPPFHHTQYMRDLPVDRLFCPRPAFLPNLTVTMIKYHKGAEARDGSVCDQRALERRCTILRTEYRVLRTVGGIPRPGPGAASKSRRNVSHTTHNRNGLSILTALPRETSPSLCSLSFRKGRGQGVEGEKKKEKKKEKLQILVRECRQARQPLSSGKKADVIDIGHAAFSVVVSAIILSLTLQICVGYACRLRMHPRADLCFVHLRCR